MILAHCLKCEFHEKLEIDKVIYSKCSKENCLSIYSNCVRVTAMQKFVSKNAISQIDEQSTALEICYPLAQKDLTADFRGQSFSPQRMPRAQRFAYLKPRRTFHWIRIIPATGQEKDTKRNRVAKESSQPPRFSCLPHPLHPLNPF